MERDHHGYELRAQLRDRLGLWANASFGSIYPALARFDRLGYVQTVTEESDASGVSSGSLSGERALLRARRAGTGIGRRSRKVYAITPAGREAFARLLADPTTVDDTRSFTLKMSLARYLTPTVRASLLERRRANLVQRLAEVRAHRGSVALDDYASSVMEHGAKTIELDIAWVDSLLALDPPNESRSLEPRQ
jgi:DNA-binding PadR family transcriptional regulator